jgi:NADH dehydrogenase
VRSLPLQHLPDGRVRVDEYLRALDPRGEALENVYVIGDCAAVERDGGGFQPRLAQTAVSMGSYLGRSLVRRAQGRRVDPVEIPPSGYIISLGQHSSVVNLFGLSFSGRTAWLAWAAAYLVKMVGLRKQIEVGLDHLIHLFFEHDSSQILHRREVLSDAELDLSLGAPEPDEDRESATARR